MLERADVGTDQNMDTKLRGKENSLAGEGRRRNWSGHRNKAGQQEELTTWRGQTSGLFRTCNKSDPERGAHMLERADIETNRDMEIKEIKGNSLAGEGRCWDWSGQ